MKTLGKTSAKLIEGLYDKNKVIFSINDVVNITGLNYFSAGRLISELKNRKIIASLKKGKHIIIPQELGNVNNYIGNWFIAAKNIVNSLNYYIAFYSAMDFWGMTIHPINKIFIATNKRQISPINAKDRFKFVFISKKFIFGVTEKWIDKKEKVRISDLEKTILDALFHPEYCGGITEIAKGIFLVKDKIDWKKILFYLKKYNKSIIVKRLGYISEILNIGDKKTLNDLKRIIGKQYDVFDPVLPKKNLAKNNWRLIDNVSPNQIRKIIKT
ncbi:hypothetical protein KKA23_03205 [Patescibacteria group bacterium]|nr:hypothetical protein [Patescibacteria group bacterium]MBU3922858.1 hypothetical protein [Patescibacteria group bacterium]